MTKPKISDSMKKVMTFFFFFYSSDKVSGSKTEKRTDYGQRLSKTVHRKGHHNDKMLLMIWTKTTHDHDKTEESRNYKGDDKHDERQQKL